MPKPCPAAFRRQALALLDGGRTVRDVAASLGIAESCLHRWRCQQRIDQGLISGVSVADRSERAAAKQRIRDLGEEVTILRKATAAVEEVVPEEESVSASSRNWQMKEYGCARPATPWGSHRRASMTGLLGRHLRGRYVTSG